MCHKLLRHAEKNALNYPSDLLQPKSNLVDLYRLNILK